MNIEPRNPIGTIVVGATSGGVSWVISHTGEITSFAGMIGAVCTGILAFGSAVSYIANRVAAARAWLRRRRKNRSERKRHFRDEPFEDGLP